MNHLIILFEQLTLAYIHIMYVGLQYAICTHREMESRGSKCRAVEHCGGEQTMAAAREVEDRLNIL